MEAPCSSRLLEGLELGTPQSFLPNFSHILGLSTLFRLILVLSKKKKALLSVTFTLNFLPFRHLHFLKLQHCAKYVFPQIAVLL